MKTKLLLSLFLAFTIMGCRKPKPEDQSLTVRLVEYGSNKPIADAGVLVYYCEQQGNTWPSTAYIKYDSVTTSSNGYFYLDGTIEEPCSLRVYTKEANYFDGHLGEGNVRVERKLRENPVVELYPFAYLKVKLNWNDLKGEFDYIGQNSPAGVPSGSGSFYYYSDTVQPILRVMGNREISLSFFGYRSGQLVERWQNYFTCPGFDTTLHTIKY